MAPPAACWLLTTVRSLPPQGLLGGEPTTPLSVLDSEFPWLSLTEYSSTPDSSKTASYEPTPLTTPDTDASTDAIEAAVSAGLLHPSFRTVLCASWLSTGRCAARDSGACSYAHGLAERRVEAAVTLGRLPRGYKTRLCRRFAADGVCVEGERCFWAHGSGELRGGKQAPSPSLKTRFCVSYMDTGACALGDSCTFAHGQAELRVVRRALCSSTDGSSADSSPGGGDRGWQPVPLL